jgi:hypothetical protein
MLAKARCDICGIDVTPQTGGSVANRWIVCNEHAHLVRHLAASSGKLLVHGMAKYVQKKVPILHNLVAVAIQLGQERQQEINNAKKHRTNAGGPQQTQAGCKGR